MTPARLNGDQMYAFMPAVRPNQHIHAQHTTKYAPASFLASSSSIASGLPSTSFSQPRRSSVAALVSREGTCFAFCDCAGALAGLSRSERCCEAPPETGPEAPLPAASADSPPDAGSDGPSDPPEAPSADITLDCGPQLSPQRRFQEITRYRKPQLLETV